MVMDPRQRRAMFAKMNNPNSKRGSNQPPRQLINKGTTNNNVIEIRRFIELRQVGFSKNASKNIAKSKRDTRFALFLAKGSRK